MHKSSHEIQISDKVRLASLSPIQQIRAGKDCQRGRSPNRPIQNTDVVAWYTLGFHHVPRIEDWPVMPTLWHEFLIRPVNFFAENSVMTLPHQP
jgi:Cu2+-containing amine oxidase